VNALNAVAAAVTVAAFLLALWQFWTARRAAQTERERIAQQNERLRTAEAAAIAGVEAAHLIVQRAKDPAATVAELQSIARVARLNLGLLARQLQDERSLLATWQYGRLTTSGAPPATAEPSTQPSTQPSPEPSAGSGS
jgi:hypothetical protein